MNAPVALVLAVVGVTAYVVGARWAYGVMLRTCAAHSARCCPLMCERNGGPEAEARRAFGDSLRLATVVWPIGLFAFASGLGSPIQWRNPGPAQGARS